MGTVYFHTESEGECALRGGERCWAATICENIGAGFLTSRLGGKEFKTIVDALRPQPSYVLRPNTDDLKLYLLGYPELQLETTAGPISVFSVVLNTALRLGSTPVKLLARLHGQCEIHAWVEGQNRKWLASIVEQGLRDGSMRPNVGWDRIIEFLQKRDDSPVVTSYSVCAGFPDPRLLDAGMLPHTADGELDYEAAFEKKDLWDNAITCLRRDSQSELKPDNFESYTFGLGFSAFDILDRIQMESGDAR